MEEDVIDEIRNKLENKLNELLARENVNVNDICKWADAIRSFETALGIRIDTKKEDKKSDGRGFLVDNKEITGVIG